MLTPYIIHKLKKIPSAAIHPDLAIAANKKQLDEQRAAF